MKFYFLALLLLFGCGDEKTISRTQVIMGTFCTITLEENKAHHIDAGFQYLKELEHVLSSYKSNALVYRLTKNVLHLHIPY